MILSTKWQITEKILKIWLKHGNINYFFIYESFFFYLENYLNKYVKICNKTFFICWLNFLFSTVSAFLRKKAMNRA